MCKRSDHYQNKMIHPRKMKLFQALTSTPFPACATYRIQTANELDFQVENQPRAAYIGRTALVCVKECVHSVMFLKKQLQA